MVGYLQNSQFSNKSSALSEEKKKYYEDRLLHSRNEFVNKTTPKELNDRMSYERALGALIIMCAPVVPYFASELWSGFCAFRKSEIDDFDKSKPVLQQKWPNIDAEFPAKLLVSVDGTEKAMKFFTRCELGAMKEAQLTEIAKDIDVIKKFLNGKQVSEVKCNSESEWKVFVNFVTKRKKAEKCVS